MTKRFDNILETIGNTPIVRLNKIGPENVNIFVKIESFNPMGSVKDRLALGVIEDAEQSGALQPGQTVIEATSGNTGIGLAMVCAQKGYPLVVTMAESFSLERRRMMRFLGAKVVLTPAALKGSGMLAKAVELAEKHGWFLVRQFENEANANAHSRTTAPEILEAFAEDRLDYWVTGFGTGGTLKGVSRVLKENSPATKVIVCEPDNSPILGSGIPQSREDDGSIAESHPMFRPHLMQGWSPDFIPKLTEDVVDAQLIDEVIPIQGDDALRLAKSLARDEGIFVGISAGATLAGALAVAEKAEPGSNILCMLPDTGERYLSTPLFDGIPEDMTGEEVEISRSTPNYRFDSAPQPADDEKNSQEPTVEAPADALEFLDQATHDPDNPVVLFALEWCEFCWSVRKMFAEYEIPYRSIDLDSVAYQEDNKGGKIRKALEQRTGLKTIPQIYVGGKHLGGASETFDACKDGSLAKLLEENSVSWNKSVDTEPYSFLPGWLHTR
ncbi:MAG: cysteine synthase A [Gammaproteobacteria bacterium]|jgi:cysteine synthase A|nr:cysteine synthase A [Gammaproteobacteria bacterium]MDH3751599.1 cysteine synthase A [Gammaproteobacteria bacterium]MDH3806675.1 cysteine synthase A [Gammaproteobacteria bacterium]